MAPLYLNLGLVESLDKSSAAFNCKYLYNIFPSTSIAKLNVRIFVSLQISKLCKLMILNNIYYKDEKSSETICNLLKTYKWLQQCRLIFIFFTRTWIFSEKLGAMTDASMTSVFAKILITFKTSHKSFYAESMLREFYRSMLRENCQKTCKKKSKINHFWLLS